MKRLIFLLVLLALILPAIHGAEAQSKWQWACKPTNMTLSSEFDSVYFSREMQVLVTSTRDGVKVWDLNQVELIQPTVEGFSDGYKVRLLGEIRYFKTWTSHYLIVDGVVLPSPDSTSGELVVDLPDGLYVYSFDLVNGINPDPVFDFDWPNTWGDVIKISDTAYFSWLDKEEKLNYGAYIYGIHNYTDYQLDVPFEVEQFLPLTEEVLTGAFVSLNILGKPGISDVPFDPDPVVVADMHHPAYKNPIYLVRRGVSLYRCVPETRDEVNIP